MARLIPNQMFFLQIGIPGTTAAINKNKSSQKLRNEDFRKLLSMRVAIGFQFIVVALWYIQVITPQNQKSFKTRSCSQIHFPRKSVRLVGAQTRNLWLEKRLIYRLRHLFLQVTKIVSINIHTPQQPFFAKLKKKCLFLLTIRLMVNVLQIYGPLGSRKTL